jgi:hypothetical protein
MWDFCHILTQKKSDEKIQKKKKISLIASHPPFQSTTSHSHPLVGFVTGVGII